MTSDPVAQMIDYNTKVIKEFRENGGEVTGRFAGAPLLLLTTTGAKSGEKRTTPLAFSSDGDDIIIIASYAGNPKHPAWFLNMRANARGHHRTPERDLHHERRHPRGRRAPAPLRPAGGEDAGVQGVSGQDKPPDSRHRHLPPVTCAQPEKGTAMPKPRVLTELDEWPRHQTVDTFDSVQTASPEWSDGYWFCFGDPAGEVNLITAIRLYPNTNVMDAYAIVSLDDGKQYNLRASRRLRPRIDELRVGPFWQEIIRGMRTLRIGCDDNAHGIEFDILWESKAPAYDEAPGVQYRLDGRLVAERSNYIQAADIAGSDQDRRPRVEIRLRRRLGGHA